MQSLPSIQIRLTLLPRFDLHHKTLVCSYVISMRQKFIYKNLNITLSQAERISIRGNREDLSFLIFI